jgi:hypothetical protein
MVNTHIPTAEELNEMTDSQYKTTENRLRAAAQRQGLRLEKSRARDPHAIDWCTYRLVDPAMGIVVAGGHPTAYGLGLGDVARSLFHE